MLAVPRYIVELIYIYAIPAEMVSGAIFKRKNREITNLLLLTISYRKAFSVLKLLQSVSDSIARSVIIVIGHTSAARH